MIDKLKNNVNKLISSVKSSDFSSSKKQEVSKLTKTYQGAFINLVIAQRELGYNENMGVTKEMRNVVYQVDNELKKLLAKSEQVVKDRASYVNTLAYSLFFIVLLVALASTWFVGKNILDTIANAFFIKQYHLFL